MRRLLLVGAGYIARVHAEVLHSMPGIRLQGVLDPNGNASAALAGRWRIPRVFSSVEQAIGSGEIDCAHILTPPGSHARTALPFLKAGSPLLCEKPMAANSAECRALLTAAAEAKAIFGVNQNFIYHPAFRRLRRVVSARQIGRPIFISCIYNVPLPQLATRQFGHWMFDEPVNMLLEQAVHPLSQIVALAGQIEQCAALADPPREIFPGVSFPESLSASFRCAGAPAQLRMAVGGSFPLWQVAAVCDDGVGVADIQNNRFFTLKQTRWLPFIDNSVSGAMTAAALFWTSIGNTASYIQSTAKLKPRSDSFFRSMNGSIRAFHGALDAGNVPEIDGAFGAHLVDVCEEIAKNALRASPRPIFREATGRFDVAVLGGTGFIGTHLVKYLVRQGIRVGVMARNIRNLPPVFANESVVLVEGDVRHRSDVERGICGARWVVNLAHGGGNTDAEIGANMVGGVETVARACLAAKVERLVHIGSIAGLYLGPQEKPITGSTPPDPLPHRRAAYARAKAECDRTLMAFHNNEGLPVCIVRPGIVVGEGGVVAHGGLGFFNNEQHCIGWNAGRNPLPFVLAEDVAVAIWRACVTDSAVGRSYNLVGDVRLSAREYIAELADALERPLRFHPKSTTVLWVQELTKWILKRTTRRDLSAPPSRRDLLSRGLLATFDCSDAQQDLDWRPIADRKYFIKHGIHVYRHP
ncbi:MAG: NAD-dependent epimerase/dehydratase family protein [Alphaproteobacteria bacterium]|nr:NAD-dependent epimerase/dehydratase family protein [Alphaproteobacteria bacterium]